MNQRRILPILTLGLFALVALAACRKINEATELGDGLIPPVDNITTFETFLDVETDNKLFNDTSKVFISDYLALGYLNDPEYGQTRANAYFDIGLNAYRINPFVHKDSVVVIDSVVLSLSYQTYYGDTNSTQTLRVFEIAPNAGYHDTTSYSYYQPDFATTGPELGSKSFQVKKLKDSILHVRPLGDTTKMANVVRIRLDNSIGERFKLYDTTNTVNGAYYSDSAFEKAFKGFAIKSDNSGNALSYIDASDTKTGLIIYFRAKKAGGGFDTTSATFNHYGGRYPYQTRNTVFTYGQANTVSRTAGGNWATYLGNGNPSDDLVYLQSTPGSFAQLKIRGLDTLPNSVIHRAEIIVSPVPSLQTGIFTFPQGLFLDYVNNAADTAFTFDNDMGLTVSSSGGYTYDFAKFGGVIKSDSSYRFNISRYVQNLVTKRTPNYTLRLYSPMSAFLYSSLAKQRIQLAINDKVAFGRVVFAGGSFANTTKRMRMRIVYSKL